MRELWLIRHGETPWTVLGRHTGRTDVALTPRGREQAASLAGRLAGRPFALVLTSPLARARETCELAGMAGVAALEPDLMEVDYGRYEGLTAEEIRADRPGWTIWHGEVPGGETVEAAARRAERVVARALGADGDVALFAHGHLLRILAARFIGLPASAGGAFKLDTASLSLLGAEPDGHVIRRWNEVWHLEGGR